MVLFVGLAGSKGFATQADLALAKGQRGTSTATPSSTRAGTRDINAHKHDHQRARSGVYSGTATASPPSTPGVNSSPWTTTRGLAEVAIDTGPARDLYVVLAQLEDLGGVARISVFVNPLVAWIWFAGILIAAGGMVAAWPGAAAPLGARRRPRPSNGRARA